MYNFIDESGIFAHAADSHSVSVVGALVVPEERLPAIERGYAALRPHLPKQNGEVNGRLLSELQVERVVSLLIKNEALFEATAVDMGLHIAAAIRAHRDEPEVALTNNLTADLHTAFC